MGKKSNVSIKINRLTIILVAFLFVIIIIKLFYVAVSPKVDGIDLKAFALSRITATKTIEAKRGTIYDVNNEILAQDVRSYTLIAYLDESRTTDSNNPKHVVDKEMTAEALSPLINMSVESILSLLNLDKYQVELGPGGRNLTELQKQKIEALELPGIDFIKGSKRDYPNGDFASHILGYARKSDDGEINGELGIEYKYNNELKGTDGKITYQKDAYGYQIANTPEVVEDASDGYDIYLTIDSNIQLYLENAIDEIESVGSEWATITIADASTGAIVGSASSPSFDPNIVNITNYNNPLTSYAYEPGSTMKIYSFMAAIEEGLYDGDATYSSGSIKVDEYTINDWNKTGWGTITYDTGFTYSSNVAAVLLSEKLGKDKLLEYYEKFGFGSKTGIELPNEYTGKLEFTYKSEIASASYGQGITTTPIQNIQALTSITNKGIVLKPYIVSKIVDPSTGEVIYEGKRTELGRAVSESTVNKIIELMDQTVNSDDSAVTGKKYQTDVVRLIGKTGTAQYTLANGKYSSGTYNNIRSFAGVFPKDNPQYIIYFSVKKFTAASSKLGEIIQGVVESVAKYKNLSDKESSEDETKIYLTENYVSLDVSDAKRKLEEANINVVVIGDGKSVIKQYPSKGISVLTGSKVFLITNFSNITMPNMKNWTSSEAITFANLIGLSYNIDGYGNVKKTSINAGDIIDLESVLDITLGGTNNEEENEEES
jgi:penicillin-binding protein 2B